MRAKNQHLQRSDKQGAAKVPWAPRGPSSGPRDTSGRRRSPQLEGWHLSDIERVCHGIRQGAPQGRQERLRETAPTRHGTPPRPAAQVLGGCSPLERNQGRQPAGELGGNYGQRSFDRARTASCLQLRDDAASWSYGCSGEVGHPFRRVTYLRANVTKRVCEPVPVTSSTTRR